MFKTIAYLVNKLVWIFIKNLLESQIVKNVWYLPEKIF